MSVLVDTTIWALALRRRRRRLSGAEKALVEEWSALVTSGRAVLCGPIRQDILSGLRSGGTFGALQRQLAAFRYLEVLPGDYDQAASFFNSCRASGISGSHGDMLLCALAYRYGVPIFTTGPNFRLYAERIPVRLHEAGTACR